MKETKPNTPAEFSVQNQDISDEQLETVAGGTTVPDRLNLFQKQKDSSPEDTLVSPIARVYF